MYTDKEVVLEAVKRDGWSLECASEELKADREVALTAVIRSSSALEFVSEDLRADREVILAATKGSICYPLEY